MYRQHFGLKAKPFSLIPDPKFLHFSDKHKTAYSMLEYGLHAVSYTHLTLPTNREV